MLNSYPLYHSHHSTTTNNLRRNSLNSSISLTKSRRNSFSPATPLVLSNPSTLEEFNDDYFSLPLTTISTPATNNTPVKVIESTKKFFSESKDDTNLSFLDGLDLSNNLISSTHVDNIFNDKNLTDLSTSSPTVSSSQSTIQCVRIIRRNDTAPIQTNSNTNHRRVVRVIRLSNATTRPNESSTTTAVTTSSSSPSSASSSSSASNVYFIRKTDFAPPVQINPALKHVLAQAITNTSTDENNQTNKLYGATISVFGIEFTVVSNENNSTDKTSSLVQNMNDTTVKTNVQSTNKVGCHFSFEI